jgi:predicted  nucleic acid-binding Zn-ribbon protein
MLASTKKEESNSALAALSLMRSIGTSIGPMLMVGFLVQAGLAAQNNLMNALPPVSSIQIQADSANIDAIKALITREKAGAQALNGDTAELGSRLDALSLLNGDLSKATAARQVAYAAIQNDPAFKDMLQKMQMPANAGSQSLDIQSIKQQLSQYGTFDTSKLDEQVAKLDAQSNPSMNFTMDSGTSLPDKLVKDLQSADVTNIFDKTVNLANWFFQDKTPAVILDIQDGIRQGEDGVQQGIDGITSGIAGISTGIGGLSSGIDGISQGISGISDGLSGMDTGMSAITTARTKMQKGVSGMGSGIAGMRKGLDGINQAVAGMQAGLAQQNALIASLQQQLDQLISSSGDPAQIGALQGQIAALTAARDQLQSQLTQTLAQQASLEQQISVLSAQKAKLSKAVFSIDTAKSKLVDMMQKMESEQGVLQQMLDQMNACSGIMTGMRSLMEQTLGEMRQTKDLLASVREGIPGAFEAARKQYIAALTDRRQQVEDVFQSAINGGFGQIYIATSIFCAIAMILVLFYNKKSILIGR